MVEHIQYELTRHADLLTPQEVMNMRFSLEINRKLHERVPNAHEFPLVYIGSGGDVVSAILVSGATRILMFDRHPFLTTSGEKDSPLFESAQKMMEGINPELETIGILTFWENVRPGEQLVAQLERIGITQRQIKIETDDGLNAKISIQMGNRTVEVEYFCEEYTSLEKLVDKLIELEVNEYGMMAKGGADGALQTSLIDADPVEQKPNFIIADDPRFGEDRNLNPAEEAAMYPDYDLSEVTSKDKTRWGYARSGNPTGDYQTRAVIGVLKE